MNWKMLTAIIHVLTIRGCWWEVKSGARVTIAPSFHSPYQSFGATASSTSTTTTFLTSNTRATQSQIRRKLSTGLSLSRNHTMAQIALSSAGLLGKLPPEIRNQIYLELLVDPIPIWVRRRIDIIGPSNVPRRKRYSSRMRQVAHSRVVMNIWDSDGKGGCVIHLLRVCKLVNIEASPVLYGCNTFSFTHPRDLKTFLIQIGESKKRLCLIKFTAQSALQIPFKRGMNQAMRALIGARNLQVLRFPVSCSATASSFDRANFSRLPRAIVPFLSWVQGLGPYPAHKDPLMIVQFASSSCHIADHQENGGSTLNHATIVPNGGSRTQCSCTCTFLKHFIDKMQQIFGEEVEKQLDLD